MSILKKNIDHELEKITNAINAMPILKNARGEKVCDRHGIAAFETNKMGRPMCYRCAKLNHDMVKAKLPKRLHADYDRRIAADTFSSKIKNIRYPKK